MDMPPDESEVQRAMRAIQDGVERLSGLPNVKIRVHVNVQLPLPGSKQDDHAERRSVIPEWNTYAGFRAERIAREMQLPKHLRHLKLEYAHGRKGDSVRSMTWRMQHYGLHEDHMPPSSWPEQEPRLHPSSYNWRPLAHAAMLIGTTGVLDLLFDRRLDDTVRLVCKLFQVW